MNFTGIYQYNGDMLEQQLLWEVVEIAAEVPGFTKDRKLDWLTLVDEWYASCEELLERCLAAQRKKH